MGKVLDAIESGDLQAREPVDQVHAAQPWDLASIGQEFVRDAIRADRDEDDRTLGQSAT